TDRSPGLTHLTSQYAPSLELVPMPIDKHAKGGDLRGQSPPTHLGNSHPSPRTLPLVPLTHSNQPSVGQHRDMPRQVPVGEIQGFPQVAEFDLIRLGRDGEDPQPVPLVDNVVEVVGGISGHRFALTNATRASTAPSAAPTRIGVNSYTAPSG